MKTNVGKFLIFAIVALHSVNATADSDGYFCVGPQYFAYQLNRPGLEDAHKLFVIPLDGRTGTFGISDTILPDFQVHSFRCHDRHIEIIGWDSIHHIRWADSTASRLMVTSASKDAGPTKIAESELPRSFFYGPNIELSMRVENSGATYVVQTSRKEIPQIECMNLVTIRLWKYDYDVLVDEKVLVSKEVPQECG